jgi:hypothetical protein
MNHPSSPPPIPTLQLGGIETHAGLLVQPPDGQLLYKLMTIENLLRSIDGAYLHFTRVGQYTDSPVADPHDGQQLPPVDTTDICRGTAPPPASPAWCLDTAYGKMPYRNPGAAYDHRRTIRPEDGRR